MIRNKISWCSWFYLLNTIVPIILGLLVYIVFRRDSYIVRFILNYINLPVFSVTIPNETLLAFLKNYCSDILWSYSLTFAVAHFLPYSKKSLVLVFFLCGSFETIIELLQKTTLFQGTFDIYDIIFEVLSTAFALYIIYKIKKYEENQNEKNNSQGN